MSLAVGSPELTSRLGDHTFGAQRDDGREDQIVH